MEIIKPLLNIGVDILFMLMIADYAARYGFKKAVKLIVASGFIMSAFFVVTRLI
mgnify:FL=1|jgi:hypothetical protein